MKKILNFAEKFNNETMFFLVKHDMHESRDERRDGKKYLVKKIFLLLPLSRIFLKCRTILNPMLCSF